MSIAYERWEGTLEYTFMAPVSRAVHLLGVSLFSLLNSILTSVIVLVGLMLFTNLNLRGANLFGVLVVLAVSTVAFVGLGLFAAVFPVMSAETRSGSDAHLSGLASARFRSLLSHRCPATLVTAAVGNLTGDLHFVCLPEVIRSGKPRLDG